MPYEDHDFFQRSSSIALDSAASPQEAREASARAGRLSGQAHRAEAGEPGRGRPLRDGRSGQGRRDRPVPRPSTWVSPCSSPGTRPPPR
ncbi:hypothetical protein ACRAWF_21395 [Streptomyces sp. L7]